jgi:endo-1,4-beta-D-glucanase Y
MSFRLGLSGLVVGLASLGCAAASGSGGTGGSSSSSGGSNGSGTGGTGNTIVMNDPSTYSQNSGSNANHPYPQGHALPNCTFPAYSTDVVEAAYQNWKTKFFDGTKVVRPENGNDTVSEGIGYGMLIGVFMNDKSMFDALWTYAKSKFDGNHLMTWCQGTGQTNSCNSSGSATDGDEDMAYALLMASKQWSGGSYASDASALIGNIYAHEVSGNILLPGDSFGSNGLNELDPSYFAPSYYRAFATVDSGHDWMGVLNECYTILRSASGSDGLVPNWVNQSGAGVTVSNSAVDPYFGYDACRIPFRIGIDYCLNGDSDAQTYAGTISAFYASKSSSTSLSGISDGYTTTGGNPTGTLGDYSAGMAFIGPAGLGAMAAGDSQSTLRDLSYATIRAETTGSAMKVSGNFTYFHASWGVLSLMAMSGNFWDMTQ